MWARVPGSRSRSVVGPLAIAALAFAAFLLIAMVVSAGLTQGFDAWVLLALRSPADASQPFGPAWLQETGRDFTALGSNGVMGVLVLAASGLLALARRRTGALFLLASFWGALLLETVVKHWYGRPRPELVPHATRVFTASFPSGHATVSAAACLASTLLLLQARAEPRFKTLAIAVAICLVGLIGASRVYLGVHWPTDVMAGWLVGTSWTVLCWAMAIRWSDGAAGYSTADPRPRVAS